MLFAKNTKVPVERSKGELEKTLKKYGASQFAIASLKNQAVVMFEMRNKRIKFVMLLPHEPSDNATVASKNTYNQLLRQCWRVLCLAIKAKLEIVESGLTTFEEEFMPHIVLPNGQTAGDFVLPQLDSAYKTNNMPPMLGM